MFVASNFKIALGRIGKEAIRTVVVSVGERGGLRHALIRLPAGC